MERNEKGKVVLITGASNGIGLATAISLAKQGAHLILLCRDQKKGQIALEQVRSVSPNQAGELLLADLSSQASIRAAAQQFLSTHDELDVLINNAGVFLRNRQVTIDGYEETWAVNHIAPFLLTHLLLPALKKANHARIINLSSRLHRRGKMHFDDLQLEKAYNGFTAYNQSKLANILFTRELARRLKPDGILVNAVHPGVVGTGLFSSYHLPRIIQKMYNWFALSKEQGAETSVYLATSVEVAQITGAYFTKCRVISPSKAAQNDEDAAQLWKVSELMTGLQSSSV